MMMIHRLHWWVSLMVLVLVLHQCFNEQFCLGCLEEERAALLQFKSFVNWTDTAEPGLASWVDHHEDNKNSSSTNCCYWERVQCNLTTGRVTHLFLDFTRGGSISDLMSSAEGSEPLMMKLPREGSALDSVMRFTWFINATLFLPFQQLQHLDLSFNFINGWLENEGFEILAGLKKLMILKLQGNQFNNSILTSLSALPSLHELNLGHNNFTIGLSLKQGFQRLSTLKGLQTLYLDNNYLGDSILSYLTSFTSLKVLSLQNNKLKASFTSSQGLGILSGLKSLEVLDLDINDFNSSILPSLGAFTSLKELYLSFNHLDGSLPLGSDIWSGLKNLEVMYLTSTKLSRELLPSLGALTSLKQLVLSDNNLDGYFPQELCRLKNLELLFLHMDRFEGILPTCLINLTSLRALDLSGNLFRGNIASSDPLSNLTSLEMISLSYHGFDAAFPLTSFYNHSNLVEVILDCYSANSKIKLEHPADLLPKFQLKAFQLSFCSFQEPTDIALKFLHNQYDLRMLTLKQANVTGKFPNWLIKNNTRLGVLNLRDNSFTGHFHLPSYPQTSLSFIGISNNNIHGHLQENIGEILPNLRYLNLSRNAFGGKIPSTIGVMKQLQLLDFSSNNFSGEVPETLAIGCTKLEVLKLSNNSLSGQILPNDFGMLPLLQVLYLDSNNFTGTLPFGISKCFHLGILDMGNNHLSGTIPSWISNLTSLTTLVMRNNSFEGHITLEICKLLKIEVLDLSENYFSGLLPSCLNLPHLQYLHLEGNGFTGSIPNTLLHSIALETLSLGNNKFSGNLPNWIGELTNLKILALKGNLLSGPLPYQLCHLNQMRIMDLSNNSFFGLIPPCFNNITFGKNTSFSSTVGLTKYWQLYTIAPIPLNFARKGKQMIAYGFEITAQEEVQFITKSISNFYKGNVLKIMSGMDLSCNSFIGEIPREIGDLTEIHALNLSHNQLRGRIPKSLSNLKQVESLDLSYNKLSGGIPQELVNLNFLEVFSVAHNNLSGRVPDGDPHFETFNESGYEGNPFLCGAPLLKNCTNVATTDPEITVSDRWEDRYGIDIGCFFASFATSWFISFLGVIVVLYINRLWRQMWFSFIDACIDCFMSVF